MLEPEFSADAAICCDGSSNEKHAAAVVEHFSFDVFDTAICRLVHAPEHVHLLVGRMLRDRGVTRCSDVEWLRARAEAETRCRRRATASEITIEEIYERLSQAMSLSPADTQLALDAELEAELRLARPIAHVRARIDQISERNGSAFFLSDMYMKSAHVGNLLLSCGYAETLKVTASSEELKSKAVGDIYGHIAQEIGDSGAAFHHLGDNFVSDYRNARASGWNAEHFTRSHPTSRERAIFAAGDGDFLSSLTAGCARAARLSGNDAIDEGVLTTTSSVLGPLLTGYVLWIVLDVHCRGDRIIHFFGDDGKLMAALCERLTDWLGIAIEARPLSVSPDMLGMAALTGDSTALARQAIALVIEDAPEINLADAIVGRLHYSAKDLAAISERSGISPDERLVDLSRARLAALVEVLGTEPFAGHLSEHRSQAKVAVLDSLASDGFFASSEATVADIGFRGTLQQTLQSIVEDRVAVVGYDISPQNAALTNAQVRSWSDAIWNEALLARMTGAGEDAGDRNDIVLLFADHFTKAMDPRLYSPAEAGTALRRAARAGYRHFLLSPTRTEAEIYGGGGHEIGKTVDSLTMFTLAFDRQSRQWPMGSIVRSQERKGPAIVAKLVGWAVDLAVRLQSRRRGA